MSTYTIRKSSLRAYIDEEGRYYYQWEGYRGFEEVGNCKNIMLIEQVGIPWTLVFMRNY